MTNNDAKKLIKKFAEPYISPYSKQLPEMDAARWVRFLMGLKLPYKDVGKLLTEFVGLYPPGYREDGSAHGTMPSFGQVKDFLINKTTPKKEYCPCCAGDGWIFFRKRNNCVRCNCSSSEIDMGDYTKTVLKLSEVFPNYPEAKCDAFQCKPKKDHPCPMGSQFYNAKMIEHINRIKKTQGFKRGLSFLKKGGVLENLLSSIESIPDGEEREQIPSESDHVEMEKYVEPPGDDETDIPF